VISTTLLESGGRESGLWICSTGVTSANYSSSPSRSRARFLASCIVEIDFWLLRIRIRIRTTDPPLLLQIPDRSLESEFNRQWGRERNGSTLIGTNGFFCFSRSRPRGACWKGAHDIFVIISTCKSVVKRRTTDCSTLHHTSVCALASGGVEEGMRKSAPPEQP